MIRGAVGLHAPPHGVPALRKFLEQRQQAFMKNGKEPPPLVILAGKEGPERDLIWTAETIGCRARARASEV